MNEYKPRKLVYVEKHSEPSQCYDYCNEVWYECPECHTRYDWLGRANRGHFCTGCGNWLSWAKLDYENYKQTDSGFDKNMTLHQFMEEPAYGHTWENEILMTYSQSEVDIYKGCLRLMDAMVGYFEDYLDFMDIRPENEEQKFKVSIPNAEIVRTLFLGNTSHSGGTSTGMKMRALGIKEHSVTFEIEDEEDA